MLRITWIGHSTVLIELDGVRLITDPLLRSRVAHLRRTAGIPDVDAVDRIDAALVSHLHYDHLDLRSLALLGREVHVVAPSGGVRFLRGRHFARVTGLDVGERVGIGAVDVRATHAEHEGSRAPFVKGARAVGYVVTGSVCVYFAGDTDLFSGMSALAPKLDVALLPVAGWGKHLPPGHLDPQGAARALTLLRPRVAIPIHWGTYRRVGLSRDPALLRAPAEEFAELAAELMPEVDVRVLPVGGSVELPAAERAVHAEARA
jgi:L-ascorbate metabolism protein UlaG (beta-lactamase superfamily)